MIQFSCLIFVALAWGFAANLSDAASTPRHNLKCSRAFPCPPPISPRVSFWIDVYSRWNSNDAILHDKEYPSRVYRVLTGHVCGTKKESQDIKNQKDKIANELHSLADRLKNNRNSYTREDRELLALFTKPSAKSLRRAAGRIRCQSGNRDRFAKALDRYAVYSHLVQGTLNKAGLPSDIQYLPFVESLYNPVAYSRAGAAGLWQIMPSTAKGLGLKLTAALDERLDPELASKAAARYFTQSHAALMAVAKKLQPGATSTDVSPFIITSYNYGVNGMRRAIEQHGLDYSTMLDRYRSPSFQVAVKNFYASFLAARYVARNADRYFGQRPPQQPLQYETVTLRRSVSLERLEAVFSLSRERFKQFNPALTRFVWHGWRPVPAGYRLRLPLRQAGWARELQQLIALPAESDARKVVQYTVKRGDSACAIANAFQVSCPDLIDLNRLDRNALIRVGQHLQIPPAPGQRAVGVVDPGIYRVRVGESACGIGKRFAIDCDDLLAINGLARNSILRIGQELVIPGALRALGPAQSYTVRKGDSACLIAARFRVPCQLLMAENGLDARGLIFPGQAIRIPGLSGTTSDATAVSMDKVSISHAVRVGDTACQIAERYRIPCGNLISVNQLGRDAVIRIGQVLLVPGVASSLASTLPRPDNLPQTNVQHTVREGDTACEIARQYRIKCTILIATNNLGKRAIIVPDQKLIIPGATIELPVARFKISALDQELDFSVQVATITGKTIFRINAEPEETLKHYADWLGLHKLDELIELNETAIGSTLSIGDVLLLPIASQRQQLLFERRRYEYHRMLVEEFKEMFDVVAVMEYTVLRGDSVWAIARRFDLPVWIITRYNPSLRSRVPRVGDEIEIPRVRPRSS
ncbi:MAG: LysM peptidoglycan-binding domain-containing protein [Pseudomonadota bacterium]|nr:LysM peptidoglycan-binding domain-containing protein [Pseudomonadota bacterium]